VAGAFGADDFLTDFGIERRYNLEELDYFRKYFALHCAAHKVVSIDTPYVHFKDPEGLKEEVEYLKEIGMKAKFAIHPLQIDIINETFRPNEIEVKFAQGLVVAFEKAMEEGKAAINYENKMCDVPVYKRMVNLLKRAGLR
jgi:citrate lyase subunit beta/citryl-CoA lyase